MNADKISKVKKFYSKKFKLNNNINNDRDKNVSNPFFTKIIKKLGKY